MALVCFERIDIRRRSDLASYPDRLAVVDENVYRLPWGYFEFAQGMTTDYSDTDTYQSTGSFYIRGTFTVDAEQRLAYPGAFVDPQTNLVSNPGAAMAALTARYDTLEAMFDQAARQEAPASPSLWYTQADPRTIQLPSPLLDKDGNPIFAMVEELKLLESNYPHSISYAAKLKEGILPASVLLINDIAVQDAKVIILPPRPEVTRHRMVGGEGSLIQVNNYTSTSVQISALIPMGDNQGFMNEQGRRLADSLTDGGMTLKLVKWQGQTAYTRTLFNYMYVDQPSLDIVPESRGITVSVRGVAA